MLFPRYEMFLMACSPNKDHRVGAAAAARGQRGRAGVRHVRDVRLAAPQTGYWGDEGVAFSRLANGSCFWGLGTIF